MATDQLRTHGSGDIAIRVDIEGRETQLVSDPAMVDPKVVWGLTGWSASDRYTMASDALAGSDTMTVSFAFHYRSGANEVLSEHSAGNDGWIFFINGSGELDLRVYDGTTNHDVTSAALVAGTTYMGTASFDGSNLRLVLDQVASTPVAVAGSFSAASTTAALGALAGGTSPASGSDVIGFAFSSSIALSDAEMQAHHTECRRRGHMARFEKVEHLYRAPDLSTDQVGSADWTVNGAPSRTTAEITTATDGRKRVYCINLDRNELAIDERVNIPEAKLESQGTTLRLFETDDQELAAEFWRSPTDELYLASGTDLSTSSTSITLLSTGNVEADDVVHIGTEAIKVGSVAGSNLNSCDRGYWGSTAQKHYTASGGSDRVASAVLTDRPLRVRGRRATIYTYDDGDDLQGDGRQAWIGKVTSEPKWRDAGGTMLLQIGPLTKVFDQKLGVDLETPLQPRGVYYHYGAPLVINVLEENTGSGFVGGIDDYFTGFYETQEAFVVGLTTWLQHADRPWSTSNGANSTLRAETIDGRWTIAVVVGANVTDLALVIDSEQDGKAYGDGSSEGTQPNFTDAPDGGDEVATAVAAGAGDVLYPQWEGGPDGARYVPRGYYGIHPGFTERVREALNGTRSAFPETRVYLRGDVATDWTAVLAEWPAAGNRAHGIDTADTTSDYLDLALAPGVSFPPRIHDVYTAELVPQFRPTRTLAEGSLADAGDALTTLGPDYCNIGAAPAIFDGDLADWTSVVNEAADGRRWLTDRVFMLAAPVEVGEWLAMECRLIGVYPIIDGNGKIALQRIALPTSADPDLADISEFIVEDGWPTADVGNHTVNRWLLKTGYDPIEEEWRLTPHEVVNVDAFNLDHEDRPLEITPYSVVAGGGAVAGGDRSITFEDVIGAATPVLTMYGYPYTLITMRVSWKLFDMLLGDPVRVDAAHLPDYVTGLRPMADALGIIVGRRWVFGEQYGELTLHVHGQNIAGYSPTAHIASGDLSNVTADTWDLTVTTGKYAPGSYTEDELFVVGDKVRLVQYDSESPQVVTGTVTDVDTSTHVIRVDFDSTVSGAVPVWELIYDDTAAATDAQKTYCAIAGSDARLDGDNARTYAP